MICVGILFYEMLCSYLFCLLTWQTHAIKRWAPGNISRPYFHCNNNPTSPRSRLLLSDVSRNTAGWFLCTVLANIGISSLSNLLIVWCYRGDNKEACTRWKGTCYYAIIRKRQLLIALHIFDSTNVYIHKTWAHLRVVDEGHCGGQFRYPLQVQE